MKAGILDYESNDKSYSLTVVVSDQGSPSLSSGNANVLIEVINSNEPPQILFMDTDGLFRPDSLALPARAKPSIREDAGRLHVVNDGKMVYSDPDGDNCSWAIAASTEVEHVSTILNPCGIEQKPCTQWNRNTIQISIRGNCI